MELRYDMLKQCVFVVTAQHEGKKGGLAAAWATQTAKDRILVSIGSQSATRELILASGAFAVNALRSDQLEVSTAFGTRSGRKVDKFQDVPHHVEETGAPVLDDCAAWYDCRVDAVYDEPAGSKLIVGRIVAAEPEEDFEPLIYRQGDY